MASNLTPVNEFTEPVVVPGDGDALNAASVITPLQALTNRTEWLKDLGLIRQIARVSDASMDGSTHASTTSTDFADVPGISVTATPEVGDLMIAIAHFNAVYAATGADTIALPTFEITKESASVSKAVLGYAQAVPSFEQVDNGVDSIRSLLLYGDEIATQAEEHTFKLRWKTNSESRPMSILNGWILRVFIIKLPA